MLRVEKGKPGRTGWELAHKLFGRVGMILVVVNVFLGTYAMNMTT